jgi:protein O-GlcNAc transferase
LPDTVFCWAPVDDDPLPARRPPAEPGEVVLGSFNNALKLVPRTLDLWARVMQALPKARLLIKAPGLRDPRIEAHFRQALVSRGIDTARFALRGPSGLADMMQEYAEVDIALDPLPYNGGTTTVQALWMGTPVVTRMGENFVGRMGASFLRALGHPEWVAESDDAYVAAVQALAQDPAQLLRLQRGLRAQLQASPLGDIVRYARHFEDRLWHMARHAA